MTSTSSVLVRWFPGKEEIGAKSLLTDGYRISWCAGGNRYLGFGESRYVSESDCLVYRYEQVDGEEEAGTRTVQEPHREAAVTGLSSGIVYEFRVCGVNKVGDGPPSDPSEPVRLPSVKGTEPEDRVLLSTHVVTNMRARQIEDSKKLLREESEDPRGFRIKKLVKVTGLLGSEDDQSRHPFASISGNTPRFADGSLNEEQIFSSADRNEYLPETTGGGRPMPAVERMKALHVTGERTARTEHGLTLKSALSSTSARGDPAFTWSGGLGPRTVDYIFCDARILVPRHVVSMPAFSALEGKGSQGPTTLVPDRESERPSDWDDEQMGEWVPYFEVARGSQSRLLPNETFPSDHILLFADLEYDEGSIASHWQ